MGFDVRLKGLGSKNFSSQLPLTSLYQNEYDFSMAIFDES